MDEGGNRDLLSEIALKVRHDLGRIPRLAQPRIRLTRVIEWPGQSEYDQVSAWYYGAWFFHPYFHVYMVGTPPCLIGPEPEVQLPYALELERRHAAGCARAREADERWLREHEDRRLASLATREGWTPPGAR